jgi:hypothetical protein
MKGFLMDAAMAALLTAGFVGSAMALHHFGLIYSP